MAKALVNLFFETSTEPFLKIVNMSICASWLVLIVAALRILLKKAPKWVSILLWGLVAVRLLCPFTLESTLSLIPSAETVSPEIMHSPAPSIDSGIEAVNRTVNPIITESFTPDPIASANPLQILIPIAALVWCTGILLMGLYTLVSYWRLRRRVRMAIRVKDDIYLSEYVSSPFVLGLFRPRIYLPYHMAELDAHHVIAHERAHIRRRDHWWKPLGFLLLTVHWFNPLMWLAYILLCRDIELACDEKVVQDLCPDQRASYSRALLNCSINRRSIAACPLAFGEVQVKERINHVLNYKKPAFWVVMAAVLICILVAACFLTDPSKTPKTLKWLQTLDLSDIHTIEYTCPNAEPGKQYTLYEGDALSAAVDLLNGFDGTRIPSNSVTVTSGSRYTLAITTREQQVHIVENIGDVYLCIDGDYFEDTHHLLNTVWNLYFRGRDNLPTIDDFGFGTEMTIEDLTPTGATILFRQYNTPEGYALLGGNDYFLQRRTADGWEDLPTRENPTFTKGTHSLSTIRRQKIDWEWLYGALPDGDYRIGKSVTMPQGDGMGQSSIVYAEFTLGNS